MDTDEDSHGRRSSDSLDDTLNRYVRARAEDIKLLRTIDRWGPGLLSIITFLVVIGVAWQMGERQSKVEGAQAAIMDCAIQVAKVDARVKTLEEKIRKDREDWEFEVAKLDNFKGIVERILIKAGLM